MPRFEESIVIHRDPEDVFAFVADVTKGPLWQSDVVEAEWLTDTEGVGRRARTTNRFLGKRMEFVSEISQWNPPKETAFSTVEGPFPYQGAFTFELEADGCRVTAIGESQSLGGLFGKLGDGMVTKMYARQVRSDLENLKDLLESGAADDM